jgi:hypothetical protein
LDNVLLLVPLDPKASPTVAFHVRDICDTDPFPFPFLFNTLYSIPGALEIDTIYPGPHLGYFVKIVPVGIEPDFHWVIFVPFPVIQDRFPNELNILLLV